MWEGNIKVYSQLFLRSVDVDSTPVFTCEESTSLGEHDPSQHDEPQDGQQAARLRRLLQVFRYFAVEVEHLFVRLGSVK